MRDSTPNARSCAICITLLHSNVFLHILGGYPNASSGEERRALGHEAKPHSVSNSVVVNDVEI